MTIYISFIFALSVLQFKQRYTYDVVDACGPTGRRLKWLFTAECLKFHLFQVQIIYLFCSSGVK